MTGVLIVGHGFAGGRFLDVCRHLRSTEEADIGHIAVCDLQMNNLPSVEQGLSTHVDLTQALRAERPRVVVVTVNEAAHFNVLQQLAEYPGIELVMCEKPLTDNYARSLHIQRRMQATPLAMNLVERFSPVIATFRKWRRENQHLRLTRVHASWGKNRVNDHRPTMGALSEAIHPLDLVQFIFGMRLAVPDFVNAMYSDFSVSGADVLDSVECSFRQEGVPVSVQSSFVWSSRQRSVTALYTDPDSRAREAFFVDFQFDSPRWDCDSLVVHSCSLQSPKKNVILEQRVRCEDFHPGLTQIFKVSEFVRLGIAGLAEKKWDDRITDLGQAMELELLLDKIGRLCTERHHPREVQRFFPGHSQACSTPAGEVISP